MQININNNTPGYVVFYVSYYTGKFDNFLFNHFIYTYLMT